MTEKKTHQDPQEELRETLVSQHNQIAYLQETQQLSNDTGYFRLQLLSSLEELNNTLKELVSVIKKE